MKRETLQSLIKFLVKILTRTQFLGLEHVPSSGVLIVATNHMSYIDIPLLFVNPARPDITALVTTKYRRHFFISWFVEVARAIWINRDIADFSAMRAASQALRDGKSLGISPEGTRSHTAQLMPGKPGIILLALKSNAPIVPVAIYGTEKVFQRALTFQRPRLTVRFGPAFHLPPLGRDDREKLQQEYMDEIMCRIAALMPEKYWGYYKDHPRTKELFKD